MKGGTFQLLACADYNERKALTDYVASLVYSLTSPT